MARFALCAALFGAPLVVDAAADNAFDAPKRLFALTAIAVAAAAAFGSAPKETTVPDPRESPRVRKVVLGLLLVAFAAAGVSALLSSRRTVSLDAYRALLLYALLLPLGASRALRDPRVPVGAFLAASAINAGLSLTQASGLFSPFTVRTWGNREATGALAGNVGQLAIALALSAVAAVGVALAARRTAVRIAAWGGALLFLAAMLVNQNLTALLALGAGGLVVALSSLRPRAWLPVALGLGVLAAGALLYPPLRVRATDAVAAARAGDWDRLLTYRAGPWAAARAMAAERPLLGWGPGTFGPEFVPHRLAAEIRAGHRYLNPLVTSSYAEAHSDYLQALAEGGIVGAFPATAAGALLLVLLLRTARRLDGPRRSEAVILAALIVTGAVAALTWFPLQRPITALPLLLAAGRAWRITGEPVS